jgi:hypothetical protein
MLKTLKITIVLLKGFGIDFEVIFNFIFSYIKYIILYDYQQIIYKLIDN